MGMGAMNTSRSDLWLKVSAGVGGLIVAGLAWPGLWTTCGPSDEARAIGRLRAIASGQALYADRCGGGRFARSLTALGKPHVRGTPMAVVEPPLTTADRIEQSGYAFWIEAPPPRVSSTPASSVATTCETVDARDLTTVFIARATPIPTLCRGCRHFALIGASEIYWSDAPIIVSSNGSALPPARRLE